MNTYYALMVVGVSPTITPKFAYVLAVTMVNIVNMVSISWVAILFITLVIIYSVVSSIL